jgi:hypothetical protein
MFNDVTDSLDPMIERQFTWANSHLEPTFEKLDRVLMDANRESKFQLVCVRALERIEGLSNHAPILLPPELPSHITNIGSNLNLDGYNATVFLRWLKMFGKDLLLLRLQYKGGILNYVFYVVTLVVGLGM